MKKKRLYAGIIAIIVFAAGIGLLSSCGKKSEFIIIIAGSTSVQPYAEILAEAYEDKYPESEIDIQGGGSSAGIAAAETGTADIGMSSRALKEAEQGLYSIEIAKDGLAIVVNPKNPINNLTLEDIRKIYTLEITNWKELGGNDAKIHIITREEGSGTRGAFEDLIMDNNPINPKAIVQDSNGSVKQLVANGENFIGFISLGLVDETVRALKLDGVEADWENIVNGSYTLYRPFLFITHEEPDGLAKEFIEFILSPDGQRILTNEGLIP